MAVCIEWRLTALMSWKVLYKSEPVPRSLAGFYRSHQVCASRVLAMATYNCSLQVLCHKFLLDIRYQHVQRRPQLTSDKPECVAWDVEARRWVLIRKCCRVLSETSQVPSRCLSR